VDGINQVTQTGTPTLPAPEAIVSTSVEPAPEHGKKRDLNDMTEVVIRAKERFRYIVAVETRTREAEKEDQRFVWVPGAQWNNGIRTQRMSEIPPRPVLEFDQTKPYIKRIVNDINQGRPGIKVSPVGSGATVQLARTREGLIRQIEERSCASQAYSVGTEFAATSGRGYWRVVSCYEAEDSFFQRLDIRSVKSSSGVFLDPDFTTPDGSDRRYGFVCEWLDKDVFEDEWPGVTAVGWESPGEEKYSAWWDGDKVCVADYYEMVDVEDTLIQLPSGKTVWGSQLPPGFPVHSLKTEKRCRTRVDWYKVTDAPTPLARYEWPGKLIPIVQCTGDSMMVDGERMYMGVVRRIRDPQMMFNYWFTAATERIALVAKAPYVSMAGQTENHPEWRTANIQNHAQLEYDPVEMPDGTMWTQPPQRQPPPEPEEAMVQMCGLASDLMHAITGMQPPTLGEKTSPHQSGVALAGLRMQSDIVTFNYPENVRMAVRLTGVILNDLIEHYYSEDRIIQITEPDGDQTSRRINSSLPGDQQLGTQPTTQNDMTIGAYSITMDSGPTYATARKEAAAELDDFLELLGPQMAPNYADLRAKVADWPDGIGDEVAARAFALLPPQVQAASMQNNDDPAMAPAKAAISNLQQQMQQMQQQFQQQAAQMQGQMQKLSQENSELKLKVADRSLDYAARTHEFAAKMHDSAMNNESERRSDTLEYLTAERADIIKIYEIMSKMGSDLAALRGPAAAAEGITNSPQALPKEQGLV
jgi:Phage P22-like portal protein